ncbi:MAG: hypothetical protein U0892_06280 [Pirellulales bacterium]
MMQRCGEFRTEIPLPPIQVTTVIDLTETYTTSQRCEFSLETNSKRGYFWHPLYAVRENGIPLGIVDQVQWIREKIEKDKTGKATS